MAIEIKFLMDGLDRGQPLNPEDFGFNIAEDDSIGSRVVSFNNDLIFDGTAYQYLFNKVIDRTFCQLIRVQVQYRCQNSWERLVDGYIIITESVFELDKCQVKTKLYDESFSTKINNNKGIPFSLSCTVTKNLEPITPPARRLLVLFNPANPVSFVDSGRGVAVYDAFAHLIGCMSDNLVDFASDFFTTFPSDTDTICITNGRSIRTNQDIEIVVSFEDLYRDLRAKYNLGIGFFKQANNRPVIRIEPIEYFYQLNQSASLIDQPEIEFRFDTQKIYAAVQFGNNPVLESSDSSSTNDPPQSLTFIQTPFRGFRKERFGFTGECNTSNILNVEASEIIFDTNSIEDIVRFNSESNDTANIIIQVAYFGGVTPYFEAKQYDPYGIGQSVFNGGFTNDQVSARWINGYPNSLYSFLEEPFDPTSTLSEASAITTPNLNWKIISTEFTSFQEWVGTYYNWNDIIISNVNFVGNQYVVQQAGIYNVFLRFEVFINDVEYGGQGSFKALVIQFDSSDVEVARVESPLETPAPFTVGVVIVNTQLVCNVGDIIRADVTGIVTDPTYEELVQVDVWTTDLTMRFTIQGEPFNPEELQAVNTDDIRSFLYQFERPLSMNEITSIINQTSSPIELGRTEDSLAVIDGYIKTMEVQSVIRQNAKFVLKSNEILR
jgi:hypothetical protein